MFINKRVDSILEYLKFHRQATIEELSKELYASHSTIRRDLVEMEENGLVKRYHGGAILLKDRNEIPLSVRTEQGMNEKECCAEIAVQHIPDFNTVFIDNSSTCLALTNRLTLSGKTVITNSLQIALLLSRRQDLKIIVTGGSVQLNTGAISGSLAVKQIEMFQIDLMLSSCAAINGNGAFELSLETAQLKQTAMACSKKRFLIADRTKFGADAPFRSADIERFDSVITNADEETVSPLRERGITVFN